MPIDPSSIEIALTPRFQKDLRNLVKRYRSIRKDLQTLIEQLQSGKGLGMRLLVLNIKFSRFVSKTVIPEKEKVAAIELSTI
jgi:hypothetical protein